jgi:large subunit ribosomal protein L30
MQVARLIIKQTRSGIGQIGNHKRVLKALGLKHPGSVVEHVDSPIIRGMVEKVKHLITIEMVEEETKAGETE